MERLPSHKRFARLVGCIPVQAKRSCLKARPDQYRHLFVWRLQGLQRSRLNPEWSFKAPLTHTSNLLTNAMTGLPFANQRCVWLILVARLVDTLMILYVRSLTRLLHFRATECESVSGDTAEEKKDHCTSVRTHEDTYTNTCAHLYTR